VTQISTSQQFFLLKTEVAYFDTIKYSGLADTKSRIDSLIGVEYTGISDGSINQRWF
jgi:hypothetical protein